VRPPCANGPFTNRNDAVHRSPGAGHNPGRGSPPTSGSRARRDAQRRGAASWRSSWWLIHGLRWLVRLLVRVVEAAGGPSLPRRIEPFPGRVDRASASRGDGTAGHHDTVVDRRDAEPRPVSASARVRGLPSGRSGDRGWDFQAPVDRPAPVVLPIEIGACGPPTDPAVGLVAHRDADGVRRRTEGS